MEVSTRLIRVQGHIPGLATFPAVATWMPTAPSAPRGLRQRFEAVGVRTGADLEHAGSRPGRLFPGSWSQYCRTDVPVATGRE